jgi:hypothetical protein
LGEWGNSHHESFGPRPGLEVQGRYQKDAVDVFEFRSASHQGEGVEFDLPRLRFQGFHHLVEGDPASQANAHAPANLTDLLKQCRASTPQVFQQMFIVIAEIDHFHGKEPKTVLQLGFEFVMIRRQPDRDLNDAGALGLSQ